MILEQLGMLDGKRFHDWSQLEMGRIYKGKLKTGKDVVFYAYEYDMWNSLGNGYSVKCAEKGRDIIDVFSRKRHCLHDFAEIEPTDIKRPKEF